MVFLKKHLVKIILGVGMLFGAYSHASDNGKVYVKGIPSGEISKGELKDALIDSDNKDIAWKCDLQYRDDIKANLRTQAGTSVFVKGSLKGETSQFKVYKDIKNNGGEWYLCKRQVVDKVTGSVRAR